MVAVDIAALRSIEREKEIPFETLVAALETALLTAYKHTPHSMPHARVAIDRKSGEVVVWAQDLDADGELVEEYDDTPTDFGRVAAMTARQVILQRLRDVEHDQTFGEYSGREGDIVTGVVQADAHAAQRGVVLIDIGKVEAVLPQAEQVPGEQYTHGSRIRAYVTSVVRGRARSAGDDQPHPPEPGPQVVRPRGPRDRRRRRRDHGRRPRGRAPDEDRRPLDGAGPQRQGRLHRPDGPAGPQRRRRAARREDRHHRLVGRRRRPTSATPCRRRPRCRAHVVDPATQSVRVVVPDFQLSLAIGREGQNARLAARLTGSRIDIHSDAEPAAAPRRDARRGPGRPTARSGPATRAGRGVE